MSPAALALTLVRALPASPATLLARLLVLGYLAFSPASRAEARYSCRVILGRVPYGFWLRNGWRTGFNLALMARLDAPPARFLIDKAEVSGDNDSQWLPAQDMHTVMASFHFGLWEFLPAVFRRRGYRVALAVGPQRDRALGRMLDRLRSGQGVRLLRDAEGLTRRGRPGLAGFMLDNTSRGRMSPARSAGVRMRLPGAAFRLARARRGGPRGVVPLFGTFERGRLRIRVYPPGDEDHALACLLSEVRRRPADWVFWGKAGALEAA